MVQKWGQSPFLIIRECRILKTEKRELSLPEKMVNASCIVGFVLGILVFLGYFAVTNNLLLTAMFLIIAYVTYDYKYTGIPSIAGHITLFFLTLYCEVINAKIFYLEHGLASFRFTTSIVLLIFIGGFINGIKLRKER